MPLLRETPLTTLMVGIVALVPAAVTWWTGRALARTPDDPLVPERLHAMKTRARSIAAAAWILIVVFAPSAFWTLIPLMLIARAVAAYPLRRVLYGETWSVFEYLWFYFRLTTAFFGFWLLLLWTPQIAELTGRADWIAGAALGAVLMVWNEWSTAIVRCLTRATPVTDPEMVERFGRLVAQTGLPAPRFEIVPMGGGVLANAVALPSRRGSGVLMSSTFADRFDRDESVAIAGHELAHLEYYSGRRLDRMYFCNLALIAGAAAIEPLVRLVMPAAQSWTVLTWFTFVICVQAFRVRSRQKNETASDLRAVALTGDPEALARALIKLHAMARVPRRWDADFERHASHPSLASRIRAIRDAAGRAAAVLEHPEAFVSGSMSIALEHDRLRWSENGLEHAVAYSRLVELRVDARRPGAPRLIAVDRSRKRWSFALSPDDAPRAQRALDCVDGRLAETAPSSVSLAVVRVVALATAVVAFSAAQIALVIPLLLAFARPSAALAAGAATAAITSAILVWRDGALLAADWAWWAVTLAICGTALLALAWAGRHDESPQPLWKPLTSLAICALAACAGVFASGTSAVQLYRSAHASPSAIVLPAALAAALAWTRRTLIRRAAMPVLVVAALLFGLGSRTYVESFGRDRFFAKGPALSVADLQAPPLTESTLPFPSSGIVVSPGGTRIAVHEDGDDRDQPSVYHVGAPAGPFEPIESDEVFFLSDDRLLTVNRERSSVVLRELRIANREVLREQRVDGVNFAIVGVSQRTSRWSVLGTGANEEIVRIEGSLAGEPDVETRWPRATLPSSTGWVQPVAASDAFVLMRRQRYHAGPFGYGYLAAVFTLFTPTWTESDFWISGDDDSRRTLGTSGLTIDCSMRTIDDRPLCTAFDGSDTTVFSVDMGKGHLDAAATLHGHFSAGVGDASGWTAGRWDGHPIAFRTGAAQAWRIRVGDDEWVRAAAANDHIIATIGTSGTRSMVRTYATPITAVTGQPPSAGR
jgi:Zn-dependent protease with chaperone function